MRQIPRLFVPERLQAGLEVVLPAAPTHYLKGVLRLAPGSAVTLLDDYSGEWAGQVSAISRREVRVAVRTHVRPREVPPDLWLLAAPIRPERFQWTAEKATELGIARIVPVQSSRVNHARQNAERMRAHMVEAAEQCGRTALPELAPMVALPDLLATWPGERALFFADEEGGDSMAALLPRYPAAILIGPEGGFSDAERAQLLALPAVRRLALGRRILRADTAAVAAIAQFQLLADAASGAAESGWRAADGAAKAHA